MNEKQKEFLKWLEVGLEDWWFERGVFANLVEEGLSSPSSAGHADFAKFIKTAKEKLSQSLASFREESIADVAAFNDYFFDTEMGLALYQRCRKAKEPWNSEEEIKKFNALSVALGDAGADWNPQRLFFLTVATTKETDWPAELTSGNALKHNLEWRRLVAVKRFNGATWKAFHDDVREFSGKESSFWWEFAKGVTEGDAKKWLAHLGAINFIPETELTCVRTLGTALLTPDPGYAFYKNIEDWGGTPEARKRSLSGGRRSKKGLGKVTPVWTGAETLAAKRMAWHAEICPPSHAQSLPLFTPYFTVPNEFWEPYAAAGRAHPAWAKTMMSPDWLTRLGAVGDIEGGWRTNGRILALETDARLRLAEKHPEVDEAVSRAAVPLKDGAKIRAHWEQMRLEWRHSTHKGVITQKAAL